MDVGNAEMLCGLWKGQPGAMTVRPRPHHEIFTVLSGLIQLEDSDGNVRSVGPGEGDYIPKGWSGIWRTVEFSQKTYVLLKSVKGETGI